MFQRCRLGIAALTALVLATPCAVAQTIRLGQTDMFGPGNAENWANGGPIPDPQILTGGPAGPDDHYMRVSGDGSGTGGKITCYNRAQWIGDYIGGGVTAIEMDLRSFASTTLQIRLAFKRDAGFGSPGYCTSIPFTITNDGRWHHAVFSLDESAFTPLTEPPSYADTFSGMSLGEVRILHATNPSLTGTNVSGALGVDNITAIPAPAASSIVLGIAFARRRRRTTRAN